jgi:hypothetical protein
MKGRTSWINRSDNTIQLEIAGILFYLIQAENYGHADALRMAWNRGKMKEPSGQGFRLPD